MPSYSQDRLESRILRSIGLMITQREIKNGKVSTLVSPTCVTLSSDNSMCSVGISGPLPEGKLLESIEGLNQSKGFMQKKLAAVLRTKNTPKLRFYLDGGERQRERIEFLLKKANADRNAADGSAGADEAGDDSGAGDVGGK